MRQLWKSLIGINERRSGTTSNATQARKTLHITSGTNRASQKQVAYTEKIAEKCWIPFNKSVNVRGYTIQRGLIYVGSRLVTGEYLSPKENCLIDPSLPVYGKRPDYEGSRMSYWPSYSHIPPESRAAYLEWLSKGANDKEVYIGYVFLYFYGLERRLIKDRSLKELDIIAQEVNRLKKLYGHKGNFGDYAEKLLDAAVLLKNRKDIHRLRPRISEANEPRMATRIALAQAALQQEPVSAEWMLAWLYEDPETSLRAPARRAPEEFRELFWHKFKKRFANGFYVKPNKRTVTFFYRAASSTFDARIETDIPDITKTKGPINKIRGIYAECCGELNSYSRFLRQFPIKKSSRHAIAHLPKVLAVQRVSSIKDSFIPWLIHSFKGKGFTVLNREELFSHWVDPELNQLTESGSLKKKDLQGLCEFLSHINIGIEPDIRITGKSPKKNANIVLYRGTSPPEIELSDKYWQAATMLKLMAAVAHADSNISADERKKLISYIRSLKGLRPAELSRLAAHLYYLLNNTSSLRNIKEDINKYILPHHKHEVAEHILLIAVADGYFDPKETKIISKIYALIGLKEETIYSDLHSLGADGELTKVKGKSVGDAGYAIPRPGNKESLIKENGGTVPEGDSVVNLDINLIKKKMEDTKKAASLLHQVFAEEDFESVERIDEVEEEEILGYYDGLAPNLASLLRSLLERDFWTYSDYKLMAAELGLMPEGALESINEWFFDIIGEPLLEGGEQIEIYKDIWEEYINE